MLNIKGLMNKYIYPILLAIFIFVYAYQHRYMRISSGAAVMDTWKGVLLIPNDKGEYVVYEGK